MVAAPLTAPRSSIAIDDPLASSLAPSIDPSIRPALRASPRRSGAVLGALACSLWTSAALASPRADPTSGRAVFTGAASAHPTSILVNPAILGIDSRVVLYSALTLVLDQEHIATQVEDEAGALTPGATLSDSRESFGGELSLVSHPTQRISFGALLRTAPADRFFAAAGAPFHAEGGQQRDVALTVGGSLQVSDIFFLGAAIGLGGLRTGSDSIDRYLPRPRLALRFARDTILDQGSAGLNADCGGVRCGIGNPEAIEHYDIEVQPSAVVSNQNLVLNLGVALKLGHDTYVGLAYHTPPGFAVQSTLVGDARVTRAPRDGGGVVEGGVSVDVSYPANVELGVCTPLSEGLLLSAGGRWEDTSRLSGYDVRPYGRDLAAAGVPEWIRRARGLQDTVAIWAGVEQLDGGQPWRFGARLGYETAAIDDSKISPGNNQGDSVTLDGGAQWRIPSTPWAFELNYGLAYFPSTSVTRSQYSPRNLVDCVDSGYDYASSECRAAREGYALENANGEYQRLQHSLRLGVRYEY
jgi:hypothetical protein